MGPFVGSDDHIVRVVNRNGNACRQARVHWLLASLVPYKANTISSHFFFQIEVKDSSTNVISREAISFGVQQNCSQLKLGTALQTLHYCVIPTDQSGAFLKIAARAKNRLKGANVGTDPNMGDSFSYLILSWHGT